MQQLLPAETSASLIGQVHLADCLELCERVYRAGVRVDMILADLPYQVTQADWDTVIPFDPMWKAFTRITKPKAAIVLTASQPFTSALVMSNPKMFKYSWVWDKCLASGFLNAAIIPLKRHEDVLVFSKSVPNYYPEMRQSTPYRKTQQSTQKPDVWGSFNRQPSESDGQRYPTSIITFSNANQTEKVHPTQKPVDLFRYLIRTYTQPNELVFDPCVGSGTTAIAAREEGRRFVCGDSSAEYVAVARNRLAQPYTPSFLPQLETA